MSRFGELLSKISKGFGSLSKKALDKADKIRVSHVKESVKNELDVLITDFWMVAAGTAKRLARYGVFDMRGITQMPTDLVYKIFGINAELLIAHAWGRETCRMCDIKNYKSKTKCKRDL